MRFARSDSFEPSYLGLEPLIERYDVWMMHSLQHLHFIIHHLFVASNVLLENDLDGALSLWAICFPHDAVRAGTERFTKAIVRSRSVGQVYADDEGRGRTHFRS